MGDCEWRHHVPGADPELDVIVARRFGSRHEKPCARPDILTCALWECQSINRCQHTGIVVVLPSPPVTP